MSKYQCEGFIKEVKINNAGKVTFTLEPAAPYLFEKKEEDGKVKKLLLFVDDIKTPNEAKIYDDGQQFSAPSENFDLSAMLIAKANRLKLTVNSTLGLDKRSKSTPCLMSVEELTVL